jgi:lipase maturation factor 1
MIYDGDCYFCTLWIHRWQQMTGDQVDYLPFQDPSVVERFPEVPRGQFETAVQIIETDGAVYGGAEAVFRSLGYNPHKRWLLEWHDRSPLFAHASEWAYRLVARNRGVFSILTRLGWGRNVDRPAYQRVRRVFLRSLGAIYLVAFVSLWTQIIGLVGSNGILPAKAAMESLRLGADVQHLGLHRYHLAPTLCWLGTGDGFLKFQCAAGAVLAVLLIIGIAPAPCLFLLWLIYLSLATVCREFLSFQWDSLLLEVGFLAIFLAPLQLRPRTGGAGPPSRIVLWLLRGLLFKLMFQSGCVKLLSGDLTWRHLTALKFYFETQPLPTWVGWYAHQLPLWALQTCTAVVLGIEILVPFLIFAPRRPRQVACLLFILLEGLIFFTGNYCFFNLLTIALCVLLLDDAGLEALVPARWRQARAVPLLSPAPNSTRKAWKWPVQVTVPLAAIAIVTSLLQFAVLFRVSVPWPRPLLAVYGWLEPFRTFNSYGLFAVMTTSRPEIAIQGSKDGVTWVTYEFKYKPGNVKRRPGFVAPHQPRLDWQMWFAALGNYQQNPWLLNLCVRLLRGSPEVLGLLGRNPFPAAPPRFVRAVVFDYHFTDFAARRKNGAWWWCRETGQYLPTVSLRDLPQARAGAPGRK